MIGHVNKIRIYARNKIHRDRIKIEAKIDDWYVKLKKLQDSCPHDKVSIQQGSNTGNYDPHADCWWTDYHCPDCNKKWTVNKFRYE